LPHRGLVSFYRCILEGINLRGHSRCDGMYSTSATHQLTLLHDWTDRTVQYSTVLSVLTVRLLLLYMERRDYDSSPPMSRHMMNTLMSLILTESKEPDTNHKVAFGRGEQVWPGWIMYWTGLDWQPLNVHWDSNLELSRLFPSLS